MTFEYLSASVDYQHTSNSRLIRPFDWLPRKPYSEDIPTVATCEAPTKTMV